MQAFHFTKITYKYALALWLRAVAILALINEPWSHAALAAPLRKSHEDVRTCLLRAALRATGDPQAQRVVEAWEVLHLGNEANGNLDGYWTALLGLQEFRLTYAMNHHRDRVQRVRSLMADALSIEA